jgi:pimeloyl-ACP methyl ester carboxylesterase
MGGLIAQYLAASHPAVLRHVALVASAYRVCDWGREVDARIAEALERGDEAAAGRAFAEYLLPGPRQAWARRLAGPALRRSFLTGYDTAAQDVLVEARAEMSFDSRPVLPLIQAPVLLASGDVDRFFTRDLVELTAASIPDCTLVWYPGQGHFKVSSSSRVGDDVLAFVDG